MPMLLRTFFAAFQESGNTFPSGKMRSCNNLKMSSNNPFVALCLACKFKSNKIVESRLTRVP